MSTDQSKTVSWTDAPAVIERIARAAATERPVIGITGPVGAGKSTLAQIIAGLLEGIVLSTDDYLPDYHTLNESERDRPEHADLAGLRGDLQSLRAGRSAQVPVWCFQSHRRVGTRLVDPRDSIICEGIHTLHETLRATFDVKVFVEAPTNDRWQRWKQLEESGERGWGVKAARTYFERVAEPTFNRFADGYRNAADIVVLNPATLGP